MADYWWAWYCRGVSSCWGQPRTPHSENIWTIRKYLSPPRWCWWPDLCCQYEHRHCTGAPEPGRRLYSGCGRCARLPGPGAAAVPWLVSRWAEDTQTLRVATFQFSGCAAATSHHLATIMDLQSLQIVALSRTIAFGDIFAFKTQPFVFGRKETKLRP